MNADPSLRLPKCLIVDDLTENLIALKTLLNDEKVEIHTAQSGPEALEYLLNNDYALSLLDVQMPGMDGFELAEIMRGTKRTKSIPIIFVTAGDSDTNRIFKGYEAGAVDFLHKPLYPQVVLSKIRIFLELYNQQKLVEDTLKRANEELELKVQERTQALIAVNNDLKAFSYSVSHDLRAPLRSVDGFSKAVLDMYHDRLDERGKDYLRRIRDSSQKMGNLIDGLLLLARLGRQEMCLQQINLSALSEKILHELEYNEPHRKVEFNIAPRLIVEGDLALITSLMENLLGNAWKYTSKMPNATISVGAELKDGRNVIYVKDNGAGFDNTYSDKLFVAFQRLHDEKDFKGTGIGLATSKRIVERHNGNIWAMGMVDSGATFYFQLPSVNGNLHAQT